MRAEELGALASWVAANADDGTGAGGLHRSIDSHLLAARQTAEGFGENWIQRRWHTLTGSSFERSLGNLDAVEANLLRLAPSPVVIGTLPSIHAHVNRFLPRDDPRRMAVEKIALDKPATLEPDQRDALVNAQHAANAQRRRDLMRVRTFRNLVVGGIIIFSIIGISLGLVGQRHPNALPLCFTPEADGNTTLVCPQGEKYLGRVGPNRAFTQDIDQTVTPGDVWLVEFLGIVAAALAGAAALRKLKGSSTPYAVSIALIVFKLPTGAVTAVVGLLLMRAEFVPGLSALDSSGQILGWAIVFGMAQHLVTRWVDKQADGLLEKVGGRGAAGDRPLKAPPSA